MKAENQEDQYRAISDSQYAYDRISGLLTLSSKLEEQEPEKKLMIRTLKFIVKGYRILGGTYRFSDVEKDEETLKKCVKVFELKTYVRENFIKDCLVKIARADLDLLQKVGIIKRI